MNNDYAPALQSEDIPLPTKQPLKFCLKATLIQSFALLDYLLFRETYQSRTYVHA